MRATAVSGDLGVRHFRDEDEPQVLELLRAALGTGPIGARTPELFRLEAPRRAPSAPR